MGVNLKLDFAFVPGAIRLVELPELGRAVAFPPNGS